MALSAQIHEVTIIEFKPGNDEDLSLLKSFGLPASVLDFYGKWEPRMPRNTELTMDIKTRLFSIKGIQAEIEELEPSCYLKKYGYEC